MTIIIIVIIIIKYINNNNNNDDAVNNNNNNMFTLADGRSVRVNWHKSKLLDTNRETKYRSKHF